MAGGAGEVARTAKTELKGLRKQARHRAGRRADTARHAAASRLQDTAARLASAADAVENGRGKRKSGRRWPRVALVVGAVVAAGLFVARQVRGVWHRDQIAGEGADETGLEEPAEGGRPGQTATGAEPGQAATRTTAGRRAGSPAATGGASREAVRSGTSSGGRNSNTHNDGS